jgi:hypothetical protein
MKYVVEMDSGAMIHVHTKFHKDLFSHSEVESKDTQTALRSFKPTFIFSK